MTFKKPHNKGFTLIETMVAITILLVAVAGPLSVIGGTLSQISHARDQMIAVNLAQEGIEMVRQKRDSNMLRGWGGGLWNEGLIGTFYVDNRTLSSTGSERVRQDPGSGEYTQGQGGGFLDTKFSRTIQVSSSSSDNRELNVTATVSWQSQGGANRNIVVTETLFHIDEPNVAP